MSLAELRQLLDDVDASPDPIERAQRARWLSDVALAEISAHGDAAVCEAVSRSSRGEVAEAMGVSVSSVNKAIRRHRQRSA